MNHTMSQSSSERKKRLSREEFLQLLTATEGAGSYRFGRQAAIAWLAVFPGDLEVQFRQARFLLLEGKSGQAVPLLEKLVQKDPEWIGAVTWLAKALENIDAARSRQLYWAAFTLGAEIPIISDPPEWARLLRQMRELVINKKWIEAQEILPALLGIAPDIHLMGVIHLRLAGQLYDAQAYQELAELYYERDSENLAYAMYLADAWMDIGQDQEAVKLLHQSMTFDAGGQVPERLWGNANPYRSLWPESLGILFDIQIPAEVAGKLGWNILPVGELPAVEYNDRSEEPAREDAAAALNLSGVENVCLDSPSCEAVLLQELPVDRIDPTQSPTPKSGLSGELAEIEAEFELLARKLKRPGITKADGRFPTYVIFSTRKGLEQQYGAQTTGVLDVELKRLAEAVRKRTGWAVKVFYPDTPECAAEVGFDPVSDLDPWKLKLALADLDQALAKKGEMIGALLIVGGPDVVPFHALPNPADDYDEKVLSDNPYATLDGNYFVPAWPVGRLPGEKGSDAGLLLEQLRVLITYHNQGAKVRTLTAGGLLMPLLGVLQAIIQTIAPKREVPNSGYSAQVWRRSSTAVFRPVGNPGQLYISPPVTKESVEVDRLLAPQLGYYNLHGLEDGSDWYGQRDPSEGKTGADYPVALSPKQLNKNGHAPRVVFSEACYGGNITDKTENDALCLKFLSLGTLSVVGSTAIAYGAMNTPLIAADLLGNYFWQQLKAGKCVGEALMIAKIEMAREMVHRQGCLDAEDQKTLLSFVLYGDPMIHIEGTHKRAKMGFRLKKQPIIKVAAEHPMKHTPRGAIAEGVIAQVKTHLEAYLPGIDTATIQFSQQVLTGHSSNGNTRKNMEGQERYVVTLSKQVPMKKQLHRHFARATFSPEGKLVKLAVSR